MLTSHARFCTVLALLLLSGCTTNVSRFQMPGTDLAAVKTLFVELPGRERHAIDLHARITSQLERRGYEVATKSADQEFAEGDFLLAVAADWHWDLTWYLLELRVAIYEPQNSTLVAQAHSLQSSAARKNIDTVVDRAMASLFEDPSQ